MNAIYARWLALFFLASVGTFQIAMGISRIRKRSESKFWGWVRIGFGFLMGAGFFALYFFLARATESE